MAMSRRIRQKLSSLGPILAPPHSVNASTPQARQAPSTHRDSVNAKVMQDPRLPKDPKAMPFDGMRMFWGGFKAIVEL